MATAYKTPGVYVEEIAKFPPSVAQVETAIPAFIGYTEKATNKIKGDLKGVPTRLTSLLEYETWFGFAKPEKTISVTINDTLVNGTTSRAIVVDQPSAREPFLMYYSMQMYFANGGGPCYVVSVGRYGSDLDAADTQVTSINNFDDLKKGLGAVEKVDEVTLIVFPDATALSTASEFYGLYNDALTQCNKLQDRFTIIDTLSYDSTSPTDSNIDDLRNFILSDKDIIKYGAAYYPFLKTILDYQYNPKDITIAHYSYSAEAYETIKKNLEAIENLATGMPATVKKLVDLTTTPGNIAGDVSNVLFKMYDSVAGFDLGGVFATNDTKKTDFLALVETLLASLDKLADFKAKLNAEATAAATTIQDENPVIATSINAALAAFNADFVGAGKIDEVTANLHDLYSKMQAANTDVKVKNILNVNAVNFDAELKKLESYTPLNTQAGIVSTVDAFANVGANLTAVGTEIKKVEGKDKNNGALNGRKLSDVAAVDNSTYNKILTAIGNLPLELPPSSAIAGVYARVDKDRGVWKAPANVGLNYVTNLSVKITNESQESLNVDTTAGKSINAIRAFTGKGILVWGARTLAGNDNEWRYVPVRRFFNMVEESVKKATSQFVFEPNDANTWVKVRAMIENFLILQWRAGALAGAKPEQAFYVRVGLGQTMTAEDILNGYMHIEIGMAVVRPAEFIVLKFSHKLQEA
ncbi:phage tail sheath protein FI [Aquipluma nitroreducens]|uniref:Phage tail sheath protein FI n=1 Tax=Aquipluma nitroreducens TaxID=2010828 RepID=A0A5K7S6B9_9BACT|nr:phage tail sheath C-terminal domain-containing protein [Aquipluma nitroreducens]BBE17101.1 phage tail sheath protein FI [Aquipluma nitroreducens]